MKGNRTTEHRRGAGCIIVEKESSLHISFWMRYTFICLYYVYYKYNITHYSKWKRRAPLLFLVEEERRVYWFSIISFILGWTSLSKRDEQGRPIVVRYWTEMNYKNSFPPRRLWTHPSILIEMTRRMSKIEASFADRNRHKIKFNEVVHWFTLNLEAALIWNSFYLWSEKFSDSAELRRIIAIQESRHLTAGSETSTFLNSNGVTM